MPKLPSSWKWIRLGTALETDVGFAFKSNEFSRSGIPLLRGENIEPGKLRWVDTEYWPNEKVQDYKNLLVGAGEIIIAMDRPVISSGLKVAVAKESDVPCLLVQRVCRIRKNNFIDTGYLYRAVDNNRFVKHCLGNQTGTQLPHISEEQIQNYSIPFCHPLEQMAICERLQAKLSACEAMEDEIDNQLKKSETLRQSILKKAFSGKLVAQDPNDEPASILLERIREEKESQSGKKKPKQKRRVA